MNLHSAIPVLIVMNFDHGLLDRSVNWRNIPITLKTLSQGWPGLMSVKGLI